MKPKIIIISSLRLFAVFPMTSLTTDTVKDRIVIRLIKMFRDGGMHHFGTVDVDGTLSTSRGAPHTCLQDYDLFLRCTLLDNGYK